MVYYQKLLNNNNTPHTSLDNITPNDAISDPKKRMHVMHLKGTKSEYMIQHYLRKGLNVDGVMRYTWYNQQVGRT